MMDIQLIPTKRQAIESIYKGDIEPLQRLIQYDREQLFKSLLSAELYGFFYNSMLFIAYNFAVKNGVVSEPYEGWQPIKTFAFQIKEPEQTVYEKYCYIMDLVYNGKVQKAVEVLKGYYSQSLI